MHRIVALLLVLTAFISIASTELFAQDEILLRFKFKEGDLLTYKETKTSKQSQMGMEVTQNLTTFYAWRVNKVAEGAAEVEVTTTRIKMDADNPMSGKVEFDSDADKEPANPMLMTLGYIVGKSFTMKMDPLGKIKEVRGYSEMGEKLVKKILEAGKDNPQLAMMEDMFKETYSNNFIRKTIESLKPCFPESGVKVSSEWVEDQVFPMEMIGDLAVKQKYKVDSIAGDLVTISCNGTVTRAPTDPNAKPDDSNPMAAMLASMELKDGKFTSTNKFDANKGVLKKSDLTLSYTISAMGMEMPLDLQIIIEQFEGEAPKAVKKETAETGSEQKGTEEGTE